MKAVIESWERDAGSPVLAKTVYQSASTTPDIQHLVPVRTQPPSAPEGVGHRPGAHAGHVAAGLGLGQPEPGPQLAGGDAGQVPLLLVVVAGDQHRADRQAGQQQHQGGGVGVLGHLLDGDGQPEDPGPRAAQLGGKAQPQQVGVAERLEQVGRVLAGGVDLPGPGLDLVLGQAAHALLELGEFGREVEVHGR